jgi:hypothetical protein
LGEVGVGAAPPLFARLVDLSAVPPEVRRFHERHGRFHGRALVTTRRFAGLFGLPSRSGEFDIAVDIQRDGDAENWTRHFPPRLMRSRLRAEDGWLVERLGVVTLRFVLTASAEALDWQCIDVRVLGLPLPARWFRVIARESARDGRYRFVAGASLPLLGELVRYEGWLDVE